MAPGLAQCLAAEQQAGPADKALDLRACQAPVGAAGVPDRGEAALEHPTHDLAAVRGDIGRRPGRQCGQVRRRRGHMDVRVNQARYNRGAARFQDRRVFPRGQATPDIGDPPVNRQDVVVLQICPRLDVEHPPVAHQQAGHAWSPGGGSVGVGGPPARPACQARSGSSASAASGAAATMEASS
jgi:hypothetical protein